MADVAHTSYADKFEQLLDLFPHPDRSDHEKPEKRRWKMSELNDVTEGELSPGYLSALRKGKNKRPGMHYLDLIANAMGFPFELWLAEPEQWPKILEDSDTRIIPPTAEPTTEGESETYADLLEQLFASIMNRRTGKPFTNAEVAGLTGGHLSEEEIQNMREGSFTRPSRAELLALSNAFGVDVSYWFGSSANSPLLDEAVQDALQGVRDERRHEVLKKSFGFDDNEIDALLGLMNQWEISKRRNANTD